jgi:hypothetical protein
MAGRAADDLAGALGADGRALAHEAGDGLSVAAREAGDVAQAAADATRSVDTIAQEKSTVVNALTNKPVADVRATMEDGATQVQNGITRAKSENPEVTGPAEKNALDAATNKIGSAADSMSSKLGWPSGKTVMGLGAAAFAIYAVASFYATDGQRVDITNITPISSSQVQIDYNKPANNVAFCLRVGDTLTFGGCSPGCTNPAFGTEQIVKIVGPTSCIINKSLTSVGGVPYPPPASAPSGTPSGPSSSPVPLPVHDSSYWGRATVHTSLTNQFVGSVADVVAAVFTAAGAAAGAGAAGALQGLGQGLGLTDGGGGLCSLPVISSVCAAGDTVKKVVFGICSFLLFIICCYLGWQLYQAFK